MFAALTRLARPKDWIKQVFVLMPVPFALAAGAGIDPVRFTLQFALGLVAFSLVASAVYAYNDALDAELDREHPEKKNRPVASGRVSVGQARVFASALLLGGLGLGAATGSPTVILLLCSYAGANAFYAHLAKHIPLVDVFLLSSGFVIRVLVGCALVDVLPSPWLLLCSSTLALFVGMTKRRADLMSGLGAAHRPSLSGYSTEFLDQAMGITAGVALLSYALYSVEAGVFREGREFASLPFVAFVILEYLRLAHTRNLGGSPVDLVTGQPSILICGLGWMVVVLWSLDLSLVTGT